jgi:Heparinase II/III-like protein/Alginate lyase
MARRATLLLTSLGLVLLVYSGVAEAQAKKNWRQIEKDVQAHNAARVSNGGSVSLKLEGKAAGKDRNTMPESAVDGNVHSRCVTWGTPRTYRIRLVDRLPITHLNFILSDYPTCQAPKDLEITLSDGTVIPFTLEMKRPKRGQRGDLPRQRVDVNKDLEWVEVKVLSLHPGALITKGKNKGKRVGYGGIGEIEVITSADLAPLLTVGDYNAGAPSYIEGASPRNDYSAIKVTMPNTIPLGQYPGLFLSRREIAAMKPTLLANPDGKASYDKLITTCNEWLAKPIVHPDPKIPAQMRDRSDAQSRAHDLLSKISGWLGWAYQLTGDERYAKKAREILVGYARLYPDDYKEHKGVHTGDTSKVMAQRLSEAMWLIPLIQSYDMVHDARCMTDADRKLVEEDLIRHCIRFICRRGSAADQVAARDRKNPEWRTTAPTTPRKTVGNWTNFYNAAYIQGGIVIRDQNWIDLGMDKTRSNVHMGIGDDGMWGEGAIGYHLFGRHALVACLEPLARKGIDLWSFEACRFKNLYDSPIKYAYPDGTAPGINDSGRSPIAGGWQAMAYDFAWLRYRDPNHATFVNQAPRQIFQSSACYFPTVIYGHLPEREIEGLTSLIFDKLGYAILRGSGGGDATYLLMDYGPHGGGHGHPDKLNLILYADGDELAGEPQGYRYEDRRHAEWTRPTVAHWTLSVDQHQQAPCTGKLLAFCDTGDIKVMRAAADKAYAGVVLDRTVVQMPGYVADIYRAWGPAEHTFDLPLCFRGTLGELAVAADAALEPMGPSTMPGYMHLRTLPAISTDGAWTGVWTRPVVTVALPGQIFTGVVPNNDDRRNHGANEVKAIVVGLPGTQVSIGTVPGGRHQAVLRRTGRQAVFATVVDPYKASDAVKTAEQFDVDGPVPAYGLKVTRSDGGTDLIIVRWDPQTDGKPAAASTGSGITTNGLVTVVRLDAKGKVTNTILVGGTLLKSGGKTVELAAPGIGGK